MAIKSAKGTYIAFLDSDDIWKKNKIEKQLKFMKEKNFKISHTSYEIIDHENNVIDKRIARPFNNLNDLFTRYCFSFTSGKRCQSKIIFLFVHNSRKQLARSTLDETNFILFIYILLIKLSKASKRIASLIQVDLL